jgi:pimeloyl-ACP methyl ester carboxylesterase
MPGSATGGQAGWHTDRGWIFVACDHLGVGDSTVPAGNVLTYEKVARANKATVDDVMTQLEGGQLGRPVAGATKLGVGHSMGGCFTIVLQGQHGSFDGIASLGFSAIHTVVPSRPGAPETPWPWIPRGADLDAPMVVNATAMAASTASPTEHPLAWAFHYDDVPADIVAADLAAPTEEEPPPWRSATTPPCAILMVAPGTVATEAAAITVPVFVGVGERDVVPDPWMEPKAYKSATDITAFVCPRMAHMHNFAGTRELLWRRLHLWGDAVSRLRSP